MRGGPDEFFSRTMSTELLISTICQILNSFVRILNTRSPIGHSFQPTAVRSTHGYEVRPRKAPGVLALGGHNPKLSALLRCFAVRYESKKPPVIRNSLVGLAPYPGKFRALNQIREFHCHSFFSELRPLPVVVQ